jgi:hypothetical protein
MAYYRDLDPCTYLYLENDDPPVAIGWLGEDRDYPRGAVDAKFFERLEFFAENNWQRFMYLGHHECELCQYQRPLFNANLFIPYDGRIYAAPAGITHYISAHWYQPPDVFIQAVTACPDMGTAEYGLALAANGAREFAQGFEPGWNEKSREDVPPPASCIIGGCILAR